MDDFKKLKDYGVSNNDMLLLSRQQAGMGGGMGGLSAADQNLMGNFFN